MKQLLQLSTLLAGFLALSSAVSASDQLAVGSEGQILQLQGGFYGDLFPGGSAAAPEASVLAVDLIIGDEIVRSLVPSTADLAPEHSPTLYHDPNFDVTYVLWSSRHNGVHPYLRIAQYADGEWAEALDITGSVFAEKNDPNLSVHHETWGAAEDLATERTVFHVSWWEELGSSIQQRVYLLVFESGELVGSSGIVTLTDFVAEPPNAPGSATTATSTVRVLTSESGATVGFLTSDGRVEIVSSAVLPMALSRMAEVVEQAILAFDPDNGMTLEEQVVETMLEFGGDFHPATLTAMVESVLATIRDADDGSGWLAWVLSDLGEKVGPSMVEIGARMKTGGLAGHEVSIVAVEPDESKPEAHIHHLAFSNVATFAAPDHLVEGSQLFISSRGTAALLAWDEGDFVAYRETTAEGWSDVSRIDTTKGIDRATAYEILEQRTLER